MASVTWKEEAKAWHQDISDFVANYNWELYKEHEREYLEKKVEYILFGPSENTLDKDAKVLIKNICAKVIKEGGHGECSKGEICMAFIYVLWSCNGERLQSWPVFKVPMDRSGINAHFIDVNCRVYKNWNDFLKNNQFPPCMYCYPTGGEYSTDADGAVILEFGSSPANSVSRSIVQCLDYANTSLAFGTTAVAATSIFLPVAGPLLQASLWVTRGICAYSTIRSGATLYDKGAHKQKLGLQDGESRSCWLSIGGSILGVASSSATHITAKMAQSGQVVGRIGCVTVNALTMGSIAVNGLGLLNSFHDLIDKYSNDHLTSLDVVQFSASLLLYAHAAINVQTAKTIIENTQNGVLQEFENNLRSNRHKRMFRKVVRNTREQQSAMDGNAQVIRSLKHVHNIDDFFSALVRMDKQFQPTHSKVALTDGGLIKVNENLSVDPTHLVQATKEQRILILEATKKYAGNQMSEVEFKSMTEAIIGKKSSPAFGAIRAPSLKELLRLVHTRSKYVHNLGPEFSYPLLNAYERMELITILKKFAESDHEQILQIASILLKALGWTSGLQYVEVAYFVCGLIRNVASDAKFEKSTNTAICSMSRTQYCQAALQEFCRDPNKLVQIFNHVKLLFDALSERNIMPRHHRPVGLFEISQLASILLVMNKPLWLRVITFAEEVFKILHLRKPEMLINVVKGLCLNVQRMLIDIERKQCYSVVHVSNSEQIWNEAASERAMNYCSTIMNTVTEDSEIRQCLIKEIERDHVPQISQIPKRSSDGFRYTKQHPLILNRPFWVEEKLKLLSEEEILDISKLSLDLELWPTDYNVEYDGTNVFVNVEDKLIVIECDLNEEKLLAYVNTLDSL